MKVSVYIATSLDGFIAREDGSLDWLPGADGEPVEGRDDYGYADFFASIDVLIMGKNTFEMVQSFEGAWPYGETPVVVLSRSLVQQPDWPSSVRLMAGDPTDIIETLKEEGFKHVYIDGGNLIQRFLRAGAVDQLILTRIPVLIGRGIPLFGEIDRDIRLTHVESRSYQSGFVQSTYRVNRAGDRP